MSPVASTDIGRLQADMLAERKWRGEALRVLTQLDKLVQQAPERLEDFGSTFIAAHIRQLADDLAERVA